MLLSWFSGKWKKPLFELGSTVLALFNQPHLDRVTIADSQRSGGEPAYNPPTTCFPKIAFIASRISAHKNS